MNFWGRARSGGIRINGTVTVTFELSAAGVSADGVRIRTFGLGITEVQIAALVII